MSKRIPAFVASLCLLAAWGPVRAAPAAPAEAAKPASTTRPASLLPAGKWEQVFRDEFDGTTADLDKHWEFQNGPSGHILCSRWREKELVWYFDGREIRREPNTICRKPAPVWLSLAIVKWAGPVTDAIDGTSMDVDYVRVYRLRE